MDIQDFEGDMRAMAELAETQSGYMWSEMGRSMQDHLVYVVVSEWDDIDDVRAWKHNGVHVEVQHKWEPELPEPSFTAGSHAGNERRRCVPELRSARFFPVLEV